MCVLYTVLNELRRCAYIYFIDVIFLSFTDLVFFLYLQCMRKSFHSVKQVSNTGFYFLCIIRRRQDGLKEMQKLGKKKIMLLFFTGVSVHRGIVTSKNLWNKLTPNRNTLGLRPTKQLSTCSTWNSAYFARHLCG